MPWYVILGSSFIKWKKNVQRHTFHFWSTVPAIILTDFCLQRLGVLLHNYSKHMNTDMDILHGWLKRVETMQQFSWQISERPRQYFSNNAFIVKGQWMEHCGWPCIFIKKNNSNKVIYKAYPSLNVAIHIVQKKTPASEMIHQDYLINC